VVNSIQKRLINPNGKSVNLVYRTEGLWRVDDLTMFHFYDRNDVSHTETVHQRHFYAQSSELIIELSPTEVSDETMESVVDIYQSMGFELEDAPRHRSRRMAS
jgi:hypothetical protein